MAKSKIKDNKTQRQSHPIDDKSDFARLSISTRWPDHKLWRHFTKNTNIGIGTAQQKFSELIQTIGYPGLPTNFGI